MKRSVVIEVRIIDADTLSEIGRATRNMHLDDDLLTGAFPDSRQNRYSSYIADLGTWAYQNAFPRK